MGAVGSPRPTAGRRKRLKPDQRETGLRHVQRPDDLSAAEQALWDALAPQAERMQTLTPETAAGFRLLVETMAERDAVRAEIRADGWTDGGGQAHGLSATYRGLLQRVESLLGKFLLVPLARPVEVPRQDDDALDAWQQGEDFYGLRTSKFFPPKRRQA